VWFSHICLFGFSVFIQCIWLSRLCAVYLFSRLVQCSFVSSWMSTFDLEQIQYMSTSVSSTLQIRRHKYFRHFNIVILVGICNFSFYAINMHLVNLFTDLSFFVFNDYELVLHRCILSIWKWINIDYFVKKK
jgi:hypothetical protein